MAKSEKLVRLLLVDSLVLLRASLCRILSAEPDFEVAGECGTPGEALNILRNAGAPVIDLILLDCGGRPDHANEFIPAARQTGYQGRFLIVAGGADVRNAALALRLGASGIFLKSEQPQRLVQVIRTIMNGDLWVDRIIIELLAGELVDRTPKGGFPMPGSHLTDREQKALLGIMRGLSNRKIGASLGISESSAKNILQHLFTRTGVRTRGQLVRLVYEGVLGTIPEAIPSRPRD